MCMRCDRTAAEKDRDRKGTMMGCARRCFWGIGLLLGISILLSEQNIKSAMKLIGRAYVIDNGRIRFEGTVAELEANEEIKKRYLMV